MNQLQKIEVIDEIFHQKNRQLFELQILELMVCNYLKFYKKGLLRNELNSFLGKKGARLHLCRLIWNKTK